MKKITVTELCDANGLFEGNNFDSCMNHNAINGDKIHKALDSDEIMNYLQKSKEWKNVKSLIDYYDKINGELLNNGYRIIRAQCNDAISIVINDLLITGKPDRIYKKNDKYIIVEWKTIKYYNDDDWRKGYLQTYMYKLMFSNSFKIGLNSIECYVVNLTNEEIRKVDEDVLKKFNISNIDMLVENANERLWKGYFDIDADYVNNYTRIIFVNDKGQELGRTLGQNFRRDGLKYIQSKFKIFRFDEKKNIIELIQERN